MEYRNLNISRQNSVMLIELNRPDHMNAMDGELRMELLDILKSFNNNNERVAVIHGAGGVFSSGADLMDVNSIPDRDYIYNELKNSFHPILKEIRLSKKIFISAVDGIAAGAGMSLAFACDFVFSTVKTRYMMGFQNIGLAPDTGLSLILSRLAGAKIMPYLLSGGEFTAEFAAELGLVKIVEKPLDSALELANKIAGGSFSAIEKSKELINKSLFYDLNEYLDFEAEKQTELGNSEYFRKSIAAFRERRKHN